MYMYAGKLAIAHQCGYKEGDCQMVEQVLNKDSSRLDIYYKTWKLKLVYFNYQIEIQIKF